MRCRTLLLATALMLVTMSVESAQAATILFSENFSGAVPGANKGVGLIPGTGVTVTANTVDIVGLLNGSFFTCVNNPGGNCLDLVGSPGLGAIASAPFNLTAGHAYAITFGYVLQGFNPGDAATSNFSVALGAFSTTLTAIPTAQGASLGFTSPANVSNATLTLATLTEPDGFHGAVLDHIVVSDIGTAAVPEPSSFALLAVGVATIPFAARLARHRARRRRAR
jgi:hypothetical protein